MSLRRSFAPLAVLLIGIAATLLSFSIVAQIERARQQARFEAFADDAVGAIADRLNEQRLLLRGVAALFNASSGVDRRAFANYVGRLQLAENHPGVASIGFAERIESQDQRDDVVRRMRADGAPSFMTWPAGAFPSSAITLLEPRSATNRRVIGFDMHSEPVRREAMERTRRTGTPALSGRVMLVRDDFPEGVPGFLVYLAVGDDAGVARGSAAERFRGWAYIPLRAQELFGATFSQPQLAEVAVELFDQAAEPSRRLYGSPDFPADPALLAERRINFAGRVWIVRAAALPGFFATAPLALSGFVLGGGVLVSLLLTALALQQAASVARTKAKVAAATAELRDQIAAREAMAAQLRQMHKVEAIGQLTGGIAHDFNNMLAVIIGNLDLAQHKRDQPERVAKAIAGAMEGAARAADLTRRLLAFGRRQPLAPRVLDLNRLVADMSELLGRTIGETIALKTVLADEPWPVAVDPGQLESAIVNLAINARDAMPGGGALTVETANCRLDEAYAARHGDIGAGDYMLIAVTDNGTGMTDDVADRAVDPFFTTKDVGKGTGLGLSQAHGFVKQSGGHLKIYSEIGEGTTIKIYLPRAHGPVEPRMPDAPEVALPRGRAEELIVVAEDEPAVRSTTVEALRDLGYTVVHAQDGVQALDMLRRHGGAALLFTDVVMPRMDGRELVERARSSFPDLRVLFTTGYTRNAIVHDGRLDAGVALLSKPFTSAQLAARVRGALDRAAG